MAIGELILCRKLHAELSGSLVWMVKKKGSRIGHLMPLWGKQSL